MVTTDFPNIEDISIVGYGDAEMIRDQHWLFPLSGGGRTDLYLRSQQSTQAVSLVKTATLIDILTDGGVWQFSIARDDAPGFYEVSKILVRGADPVETGFAVTEDIRGLDLTGDDVYVPDLETVMEGVYSRYQASTIRFLDTSTPTAGLSINSSTQDYDVTAVTMPLVKPVQEFLGDRGVRNPAGDILVKAAIPCFLSLNVELPRRRTDSTVDEARIKSNLAA